MKKIKYQGHVQMAFFPVCLGSFCSIRWQDNDKSHPSPGLYLFPTTEAQKAFLALIFCFKQAGVSNLKTVGYKQLMIAMNGAQYKNVNLLKTL